MGKLQITKTSIKNESWKIPDLSNSQIVKNFVIITTLSLLLELIMATERLLKVRQLHPKLCKSLIKSTAQDGWVQSSCYPKKDTSGPKPRSDGRRFCGGGGTSPDGEKSLVRIFRAAWGRLVVRLIVRGDVSVRKGAHCEEQTSSRRTASRPASRRRRPQSVTRNEAHCAWKIK